MRVLITGGTGFVGSHAMRALSGKHELVAITRGAAPAELEHLAAWVRADLSGSLDAASLPDRVDAVVHLAQSRRYADLPGGTEDVVAINLRSTVALRDYAVEAGAERFVYASTGGVYARSPDPIREDAPLEPRDAYFESKRDGEQRVGEAVGLRGIVLRPFFVYGPGQERMLVANLMRRVLDGEEVTVVGDPGLRTTPVYVGDAVAAIGAALTTDSDGVFNIAGDEVVSISELVEMIGEAGGREARVRHVEPADGEGEGDLVADNGRMRVELAAPPRTELREGLREMMATWGSD